MRIDENDSMLVVKHGKKSSDLFMIDFVELLSNVKEISKTKSRELIKQGAVHIYWRKHETS